MTHHYSGLRYSRWIALAAAALLCTVGRQLPAVEPQSSGLNQLVVVKPGAHERGLPAVRFEPAGEEGELVVDIPPTLHIHRYFYDGDREYQGPIVLGGPTTVIANHPTTGERMYVDVTLPAGSPIVAYSSKCITYVYADRRVSIRFGNWNTNKVRVHYYSGHGIGRRTRDWVQTLATKSKTTMKSSATVQSVADAAQESQSALSGVKHAVDATAGFVVDSASSLLKMVPGVAPLTGMGDQAAQAGYESSLRAAARQKEGSALDFIRTNR